VRLLQGGDDPNFHGHQPDTSKALHMGPEHRMVCLFIPQLLMVLTAPFHAGMARLSYPAGWLHTREVYLSLVTYLSTNRAPSVANTFIENNGLLLKPGTH